MRPETIEAWRGAALAGVEESLRRGQKSPRELELERENQLLRGAVTHLSIEKATLKRKLDKCRPPSGPGRSRR